ncbi:MAG: ATP-binding protein [Thiomicrorhabdus sp.]|jgi:hypothetical protein|nr:ATP-binding protein [Thiomicrorhabdus sp.]
MNNLLSSVSISEAKGLIEKILTNSVTTNTISPNVMLHGSPGLGKSAIIASLAKELEFDLIDLRLASFEPSDLGGIPHVIDGVMKFSTPEWFPEDSTRPCIVFLDELTNASLGCQHSAYRLILDRQISNGKKLPDNAFIIGAGNLKSDKTGARDLIPAMANRFAMHLQIDPKKAGESFLNYAVETGIDRRFVGFLSWKKEMVYQEPGAEPSFPTPRTWEMADKHVKSGICDGDMMTTVIASCVGTVASIEFASYCEYYERLPNWDRLKNDDTYEYTIERNDGALEYALSTSLAFELLAEIEKEDKGAVEKLADFLSNFKDETKILSFRTMKRNPSMMAKLVKYPTLLKEFKKISSYVV